MTKLFRRLTGAFACLLLAAAALAQQPFIVVASTTSTEQSGLFPQLLPAFEKDTGINVRVVAVGTGQALDIGRRGDADVVFVHDKTAELKWLAEGEGVRRYPVMDVVATISTRSAEALGLAVGRPARVFIKASSVIVAVD